MRVSATRTTTLLALAVLGATPAAARTFQIGPVDGEANLELSYGILARVEGHC